MSPIFKNSNSIRGQKLYLPSTALNAFPKIIIFGFLAFVVISGVDFIYRHDYSLRSLKYSVLFILILLLFYGSSLFIIYIIFKSKSTILEVNNNKFLVIAGNKTEDFDLNLIDHFVIITELTLSPIFFQLTKLFIVDNQDKHEKIYSHESGNDLRKSWGKAGNKLKQMTNKNVISQYFVQDLDGQLIELDEYRKKQFHKRVPLFKSPYK